MLKEMEKTTAKETFAFPNPSYPEAVEWPGTPIGRSNTITKTKSRTAIYDKIIDEKPGKREELLNSVTSYLAGEGKSAVYSEVSEASGSSLTGRERTRNIPPKAVYTHDVLVHGIRVRAITNSPHLIQFWKDNWYGVAEWEKVTKNKPAEKPQVLVYALTGVKTEPEAAYYSRSENTVIFFNTAYYGQLKSWVLGAVGRVLTQEYGIHSIHGACVEKEKKGILYIAPTGTGKSTSSYGLMEYPNTRFHSDDWVYVRYAYTTKSGKKFSPLRIVSKNSEEKARGYRCFRWMENHPKEDAVVEGLTLDSQPIKLPLNEVDFSKPLEAYAYLSEKVFYLRCNLVESFPQSAYSILQAHLENVPDILPEFREEQKATLENNLKTLRTSKLDFIRNYFEKLNDEEVKVVLGRLFAFDNARAMLDITKVFEPHQVFVNPLEPVKLSTVMLLKRNFQEELVLETLSLDKFMERLLIGETPMGKREISYNAYRLVNDEKEAQLIKQIEAESKTARKPLYQTFLTNPNVPDSLLEEFELFRVMYKSCACYDLNTILQKDAQIPDRRTAVETTMKVIAKAMEANSKQSLHYTIQTYRTFLQ